MTTPAFTPTLYEAFAEQLLAQAPDGDQAKVAAAVIGGVAAQLVMLVGGREASAAIYAIADRAATQHIPGGADD